MAPEPDISVVLVVGNQRARGELCLRNLLDQDGIQRAEIVLIDLGSQGSPPMRGSDSPFVRLMRKNRIEPFGELRAEGARLARGRLVGYIEEHCFAQPGWLTAAFKHLDGRWAAIGGEMHTANPGIGISDAIAFMNYTTWRPPARAGESDLLPGQNVFYRREVLLSFGETLGTLLDNEAVLHWELAKHGHRLGIDPNLRFAHANETTLPSICRGYYLWHRCFGESRAHFAGMSAAERWLRALATPAVPLVRAGRMLRYLSADRPYEIWAFLRWLPVVLISQSFAALGTAVGLLFGRGRADLAFSVHETDEPRTLPSGFTGRVAPSALKA